MKRLNILFTGIGRRVELIQAFRSAALSLSINLKIYGADMLGTAPALAYCDYVRKVCSMKDADYIDQILEICKIDKIDLVIPTIDTDLLVLSQNVERFSEIGVKVLISASDKIAICRDKNYTSDFFRSCGLHAPNTYNDIKIYDDSYPCFIKPKDGSSSLNAFKVNTPEDLEIYSQKVEDYIIQPFIDGAEYTIDIFCDFEGNPIYITPRERMAVRAGEVLKTKIVLDAVMIEESKQIIEKFRPCGPMTVQLIRDKNTGIDYFIEINPRYGGGSPLSMKAGARSAEVVLKLLCGETIGYQENVTNNFSVYCRFDQSVCLDDYYEAEKIKGVIFDLDDTLYSEREYIKSGFEKVAQYLNQSNAGEQLWNYFLNNKPAIDSYLTDIEFLEKKNDCLKVYRENTPEIHLYDGVVELITNLKNKGVKIGIITDGRIEGQKNKIDALGLESLVDDIIITDELGGIQFRKPNDISFRIMQCRWKIPFEQMVYVGDNPDKDFQAPKQLGMKSIYFKNEDGLYSYDCSNFADEVSSVEDLTHKLGC